MQKRALAIHDVSCVGRCSLTVALPVLSACGIHTSVLPTALLSTHTGEFTGFTCLDLTEEMRAIAMHFSRLEMRFEGLYTGFLGSYEQIQLVGQVLEMYKPTSELTVVDPVMGDHGRLYATYTKDMAAGMGELCRFADVIVPNMTEACILLDRPYEANPDWPTVQGMLEALCNRYGCGQAVITGVQQGGLYGAASFRASDGTVDFAGTEHLPGVFYGTGDVFASGLTAAMMCGQAPDEATRTAVAFTHDAMVHTLDNGLPLRYGAAFEQALPGLMKRVGLV